MDELNPADEAFRKNLGKFLPAECFRQDMQRYLEDPRAILRGVGGLVVAPRTVEQVAEIVRACADALVPVIPFGGGTGLVGGQIMKEGPAPLILSLERMNKIRNVFVEESVIVVEAGATLLEVQEEAARHGLLFPLSLAAEGTCRIGGNLATNAGGVNVLRYGNARDLCIGLEAVLPDGEIWHGLSRLRKDNTGYDLRNLLVGSEGTLGIITAASLKLYSIPAQTSTALLVVENPAAALQLLTQARKSLGEMISTFELIQRTGLEFLAEKIPDFRLPFEDNPDWLVLIELGMPEGLDPENALVSLFEYGMENDLVQNGLIAQSEQQRADFWNLRERIPEANKMVSAIANHDVSLPLSNLPLFIDAATAAISNLGDFRINCFGHLGDGNLHFNVFAPKGDIRENYMHLKPQIEALVYDVVMNYQGSFSAEHGIGRIKVDDLERYGNPTKLAAMKAIKRAIDHKGIMNPDAVLRRG